MNRLDRRTPAQRLMGRLARTVAGIGLVFAVARELLRGSGDEHHGLVVESDGDDAWAG